MIPRENKFCPDALCTNDVDGLVVGIDDLLGDRQTKSCSFFVFPTGEVGFIKAVKYFTNAAFGNTDARIFHGDKDLISLFAGANLHF